jgi:hypothetical protein
MDFLPYYNSFVPGSSWKPPSEVWVGTNGNSPSSSSTALTRSTELPPVIKLLVSQRPVPMTPVPAASGFVALVPLSPVLMNPVLMTPVRLSPVLTTLVLMTHVLGAPFLVVPFHRTMKSHLPQQ